MLSESDSKFVFSRLLTLGARFVSAYKIQALCQLVKTLTEQEELPDSAVRPMYLRALTLLEIEMGVKNPDNQEVKAGLIESPEALMKEAEDKLKNQSAAKPQPKPQEDRLPNSFFKSRNDQVIQNDEPGDA